MSTTATLNVMTESNWKIAHVQYDGDTLLKTLEEYYGTEEAAYALLDAGCDLATLGNTVEECAFYSRAPKTVHDVEDIPELAQYNYFFVEKWYRVPRMSRHDFLNFVTRRGW